MIMLDYRLNSLGDKITNYTRNLTASQKYNDSKIRGEDIRHNIAASIADLSLNLLPAPLSAHTVKSIIERYNFGNGTDFSVEYFLALGWIRVINESCTFPARIDSHLLRLSDPERFKNVETPEEFLQQINCLLEVYRHRELQARLSLTEIQVKAIIECNHGGLTADDLASRKILARNPAGNYYYNDRNEYASQLNDRIISAAWFKLCDSGISQDKFRVFLRYLHFADLWPVSLSDYLPHDDFEKIIAFSESILTTESDLAFPDIEIRNDHLDRSFGLESFASPGPNYVLEEGTPYYNYQQLVYLERHIPDIFTHHASRAPYLLLIRLILQSRNQLLVTEVLTRLYKEHKNPYVKSQVLDCIVRSSPRVLAYFLADRQLAPILFAIINDLEINSEFLQKAETPDANLSIASKIKDDLWFEAFHIYLDLVRASRFPAEYSEGFIQILEHLSKKVFEFRFHNRSQNEVLHKFYLDRYHKVVELSGSVRLSHDSWPNYQIQPPLLAVSILPGMVENLKSLPVFPSTHELLFFETSKVDVYIELLRLSDKLSSESAPSGDEYHIPSAIVEIIAEKIIHLVIDYFDVEQINVLRFFGGSETKQIQRGMADFGLEIIDYSFLFLLLQKINKLREFQDKFAKTLRFNSDNSSDYEHDKNETRKLFIYLKISLLAYVGINKGAQSIALTGYPVEETLSALRREISHWAPKFNRSAPSEGLYDVFSINKYSIVDNIHYQKLIALLYSALATFPPAEAKLFIDQYFNENSDLEKLFTALNRIDNREIREVITAKIESINLDEFIESAISITELETVLIEAVNSREMFNHAAPLLKRVENHLSSRRIHNPESSFFVFNMKLLLALKNKDTEGIRILEIPKDQFHERKAMATQSIRKQFYLGLDQFYNHRNFPEAVRLFSSVSNSDPENVEYAFYLYNARAFSDLKTGLGSDAKEKWDSFIKSAKGDNIVNLEAFLDRSTSLDLLYYAWRNDDLKFDQVVNTLPEVYLYQEELILTVYKNYLRRQMAESAFAFLNAAIQFNRDTGKELSGEILDARDNAVDDTLIDRVRNTMGELRNLPPASIPRVLPAILNSKKNLQEFILGEIVGGMRIMRKKIKAVESIVKEDHFNDVFLATLRLRFPVFGWEIADQERTGSSHAGTDAGEADIVFKAAGQEIALLEALKMKGQNVPNLQKHVLKCLNYSRDLKAYYMVVYFYGSREAYSDFIETYKSDIAGIPYPTPWIHSVKMPFESLSHQFENSDNMFIGRSWHGINDDKMLFHLVVDLSKPQAIREPKTVKAPRISPGKGSGSPKSKKKK